MRECEWIRNLPNIQHIETRFPRILYPKDSLTTLLDGIKQKKLYGFALCDVDGDDALINDLAKVNFPPIFSKLDLTMDHLSEYMKTRFEKKSKKLKQTSLIQTFRAKNQVLHTCLIQFYLELGLEIKNVQWFTQYLGEEAIKPFIEKVVQMRIQASQPGQEDKTKSNTAKIIGNSGEIINNFFLLSQIFSIRKVS